MPFYKIIFIIFLSFLAQFAHAFGSEDLLPAEKAFPISATIISRDLMEVSWDITEGYYLYRSKISIVTLLDDIKLGVINLPVGEEKHDEFFGDIVVYRHQLKISIPIINPQLSNHLKIQVKYQGCADIGVCYPPHKKTITFDLPTIAKTTSVDQLLGGLKELNLNLFQNELLPAEQAFQFFAFIKDEKTLHVNWRIENGYYLYRDKLKLSLSDNKAIQLGTIDLPQGEPYHDEAFGEVQILRQDINIDIPLIRTEKAAQAITLFANYQGCADRGVCYPPMSSKIELHLSETEHLSTPELTIDQKLSEQDHIFQSLQNESLGLTLLSFFGFGLLLAFTPCIFPMIPILSGIIVGQGDSVTPRKAFLLSLSYVFASALTYTLFGILAALFGSNLQTTFQQPWIIALFSSIFVLLSLSMFGFYNLELPKSFQATLHNSSDKHRDGSYIGAAIMGALSSLIVGPCVAAPLAGALIYIGKTGDVILGGSALFVMGFAMGSPLLLLGASAGSLLPKAGHWLNSTKAVFGVIMLAVSVWMLDRILPASVIMLLSASLLIIPSIYLRAIDPLPEIASGWQQLWKGLGVMMLLYGLLLMVGLSMGNTNPLQPLERMASSQQNEKHSLNFKIISSGTDLDNALSQAQLNNQWVMLDFYADWCISCKEMEAYTFSDTKVQQKLANVILIQADVTKDSEEDKALLQRFSLFGPPAILFFSPDQKEQKASRVIGYQDRDAFLNTLETLSTQ